MFCYVCDSSCDKLSYYSHGSEVIHACSPKCLDVLNEHKCIKYCKLLAKCSKCKNKFLKQRCIKTHRIYYCRQCRLKMRPNKRGPKVRFASKNILYLIKSG